MQAIHTKYIGATQTKCARIIAKAGKNRTCVNYDETWGIETNHIKACRALMEKLEWNHNFITGSLGNDYVHVLM